MVFSLKNMRSSVDIQLSQKKRVFFPKIKPGHKQDFRPKEMLRDLCAIFALFAAAPEFQEECAKNGCNPDLLGSAVKTCRRLQLLTGESMAAFGRNHVHLYDGPCHIAQWSLR